MTSVLTHKVVVVVSVVVVSSSCYHSSRVISSSSDNASIGSLPDTDYHLHPETRSSSTLCLRKTYQTLLTVA